MIVQDIVDLLQAQVIGGTGKTDNYITGGYTSDLLSHVMGHALNGNVWITMQGHQNIVAVASLLGLSAVIIAGGVQADQEAVRKAEAEGIPLLLTSLSTFSVAGLLYNKGVKGV